MSRRPREFKVSPAGVKGGRGETGQGTGGQQSVGVRSVLGSTGLCFRGIPVNHIKTYATRDLCVPVYQE